MKAAKKSLIHDFTRGPLFSQLLFFALPFMASNGLQALYAIVDMAVVGRYVGREGLSAVAISSQLFTFLTMFCAGMTNGGQVYLSQLIGSGQKKRLSQAVSTLFLFLMAVGFVMTILGIGLARPVLHLLNVPADAFENAVVYTLICSAGVIFSYGYNILSAVLRGLGDSRHPFLFILIASVMNIILDLLFICCFHWGVAGAALATILGQAFSFFYALFFLYRHRDDDGEGVSIRFSFFDLNCLKGLLRLGLPLACRFSMINFSMLFVMGMVARFGSVELATFGAGIKLDDTANKTCQGVMMALTGVVAQNFGARNIRRVRLAVLYCLLISVGFFLVFGGVLWFTPRTLFQIFSRDEHVLQLCPFFVRGIIWTFPALLLLKGTNGFIHGIGKTWLGMVFGILDGCVLRIGFSWFLGAHCGLGFYGYVLGYGLAPFGSSIPGMFYFLWGKWTQEKLATE